MGVLDNMDYANLRKNHYINELRLCYRAEKIMN